MDTSFVFSPMLGVGLFVIYAALQGYLLSSEVERPLHAITGVFFTCLALASACVPAATWWSLFMVLGGWIRYVGDPVLDGVVAMGTVLALIMAWLCLVNMERPLQRYCAIAQTATLINKLCLRVIGLGVTVYGAYLALLQPTALAWVAGGF
jgi:hypothetical protein